MHPREIESRGRNHVGRVSPRIKLVAALVLVGFTALLPRRPDALYLIPSGILAVLWPLSRMPPGYALRRLLVAEVFIMGIALLSLFSPQAAPIFLSTFFKSNLCVLTMLLLTWTTPFEDMLHELRRMRFPPVMLTTLALMSRYLPVLREESRRMSRARSSRTFTTRRRVAWQNLALILGQLFIRTADRAERIYLAMCARGWK
jgi:cobalt/nickel transport system permease protein